MIYKLSSIINNEIPYQLRKKCSILYRIHNQFNGKNYIGTSKDGMSSRLFNKSYGHITLMKMNSKKCKGMYLDMNKMTDEFLLVIEYEGGLDEYDKVLLMESEYIEKYDSVINGYNVSYDGKPGWKKGSLCVNDGERNYYIPPTQLSKYESNGYKMGRYDGGDEYYLRGRIHVNNGSESKTIDPSELDYYISKGYVIGNNVSPNKGKIWVNNGKSSKIINPSSIKEYESLGYIFRGRIEGKRAPRGKYNVSPKRKVNNGVNELSIPISELDDFLSKNPEYSIGRVKRIHKSTQP